jgi:hypothetical protein
MIKLRIGSGSFLIFPGFLKLIHFFFGLDVDQGIFINILGFWGLFAGILLVGVLV